MSNISQEILEKAHQWTTESFDIATRNEVSELIANNPTELTECFYRNLEFGTGGLRGIMGVGTNRMNKYTVGMATQGLANYLKKIFINKQIKVVIAFDSRNNSEYFSQISADVLSANGIQVYLFDKLRPTPELSFAVRYLNCDCGIVVTASHNPKEYNGYKVYWNDGGQLVFPNDVNVIKEVEKVNTPDLVNFTKHISLINIVGKDIDQEYLLKIQELSLNKEIIRQHKDLKIVYTSIHGTGIVLVPDALKLFGFENIIIVKEQAVADGNFPTVKSPNPEEKDALELAIAEAVKYDADIVLATDPDADRVGIAIKNEKNQFILLNGNQTAAILFYYVINQLNERKYLKNTDYIVKTIVTTELLKTIAQDFMLESFDVLTGFKYIAEKIKELEGKRKFIIGGEESYGYLVGDFVRDKDAVSACCLISEMTAWAKSNNKTPFDILLEIYNKYGLFYEHLISITKKGKSGAEEINQMMSNYRQNPPKYINNSLITEIRDYKLSKIKYITTNKEENIDMPKSDVIQFFTADGSKITVRPSGTEPKIKFYFGVFDKLEDVGNYYNVLNTLKSKIDNIIKDMKLL